MSASNRVLQNAGSETETVKKSSKPEPDTSLRKVSESKLTSLGLFTNLHHWHSMGSQKI